MWPTTATVGPPAVPATRAHDDPTLSAPTSVAKVAQYSRHTRAGVVSCPEGPGAVKSRSRRSGAGTSERLFASAPGRGLCVGAHVDHECSAAALAGST